MMIQIGTPDKMQRRMYEKVRKERAKIVNYKDLSHSWFAAEEMRGRSKQWPTLRFLHIHIQFS
jgi:hypothetical protein